MATSKAEFEIIKQPFSTKDNKKSFLKSITPKEKLTRELKECPHCKSVHFVKNGKAQGKQRFMCMTCHKTFTHTNHSLWSEKRYISVEKIYPLYD